MPGRRARPCHGHAAVLVSSRLQERNHAVFLVDGRVYLTGLDHAQHPRSRVPNKSWLPTSEPEETDQVESSGHPVSRAIVTHACRLIQTERGDTGSEKNSARGKQALPALRLRRAPLQLHILGDVRQRVGPD